MNLTFAPRGILQIDDARLVFRNFAGAASKFNRAGDRNFAVVIPDQETADALIKEGWNVKIKPPRDEQDDPFMYLTVKVKFNDRGPKCYLTCGDAPARELIPHDDPDEDMVGILDEIDIRSVDLDIRPYDWDVNGKQGRTAYLQSIHVVQEVDRFAARFSNNDQAW